MSNNSLRPFSAIGMPYYRETLLSAWPNIICEVGAPPAKFDERELANLTWAEHYYFGRASGRLLRNQVEDTRSLVKSSQSIEAPKFLSEKSRMPAKVASGVVADAASAALIKSEQESLKADAPSTYRLVKIKYHARYGVDDFDFGCVVAS
jgi:PAB-dependent poly(A)-specific ribonuclease subunit 2